MEHSKKLKIYDASAGSGKTYALSDKYSKYLLEEFKNDRFAFKHILAVTFTNKSTFEMKKRIIDRLWEYSSKAESASDRENAKEILRNLVHDYTMFKVSTIDSFFQKVLRAFALEMGKRGAYETVLDHESAIEAAVDSMYSKLGESRELLDAMKDISNSRIEDNANWNWRGDVLSAGKAVVNEDYIKLWRKSAKSGESLKDFRSGVAKRMAKLAKAFVEPVISLDNEIISNFAASGLDSEQFKGKSKSPLYTYLSGRASGYIDKEGKRILSRYPDCFADWPDGDFFKDPLTASSVVAIIGDRIEQIKDLYRKYYVEYVTIDLAKAHIKETAVLEHISEELADYLAKEQLTLLSDAPQILNDLMGGSDVPFVYEKIGTSLNHYMLDEFQDTSDIQWNNFLPLLKDGISRGMESFLVGDVKQSIYRFRGGDWKLFKDEVKKQFPDDYDKKDLNVNYRSLSNIVEFNNVLFAPDATAGRSGGYLVEAFSRCLGNEVGDVELKGRLCSEVADIYKGARQQVRDIYQQASQKGIVNVICLNKASNQQSKYVIRNDSFILMDIVKKIKALTEVENPKYSLGDIAILTTRNNEAVKTADFLIRNGISIISGESLLIDSSLSVRLLVEALRKLSDPSSKDIDAFVRITSAPIRNLSLLGDESVEGERFRNEILSGNTLFEICKELIRKVLPPINGGEIVFVNAFMDRVLDYSGTNGTNLSAFLKWWSEKSSSLYIPEPTSGKSVRIMTMHKSKGLDFRVVFIPFLRDNMIKLKKEEPKWLGSSSEILGYGGPLLIDLTDRRVADSVYSDALYREKMETCVDTLNLAYVSFTRSKERLYIYAKDSAKSEAKTVSSALSYFCSQNSGSGKMLKANSYSVGYQEVAEYCPDVLEDNSKRDFDYTEYLLGDEDEMPFQPLSSYGTECLYDSVELEALPLAEAMSKTSGNVKLRGIYDSDENIRRGVLYHHLFSLLDNGGSSEEVGKAVDLFLKKFPDTILGNDRQELIDFLASKIQTVSEYYWFSDKYDIKSETTILNGADFWRPDRVMIPKNGDDGVIVVDYKFGGFDEKSSQHRHYTKQVSNYMQLLGQMGYGEVRGYLWYVIEDKVIEVVQSCKP